MTRPIMGLRRGPAPSTHRTRHRIARRLPDHSRVHRERSGLLMVAGSAVCFGSLAIFGKLAARRQIPLAELLALRFLGAALILWLLAAVRRERLWFGKGRGASL